MKKYFILAAAALAFAACTSDELVPQAAVQQVVDDGAIRFDAYQSRATTRAGLTGELNLTQLNKSKANGGGFGVFGYYTDGELYASNTKPNFFYNQGVFFDSEWKYTPVKYWPNEFGSDAISDQVDRVSFFAYAPYVEVNPLTGVVVDDGTEDYATTNITGMTRNNVTGDPFVKYSATMDATNTVDLCYAVAAEDFTSSNSTTFPNDIKKGNPYINVTKPGLGGKIYFDFKHALTKLYVTVDHDVDEASHSDVDELNAFTKIWVRSVTFEGITTKGALNLNNGEWYQIDASGDNKISTGTVTVYDGLKDGKEPMGKAANESPDKLNPAIIQSLAYDADAYKDFSTALQTLDKVKVTGVTKTPQNLFKSSSLGDPIYVIPTGEKMKVTIVYDVETYDPNLAYYLSDGVTPGSTIQNSITKTIDTFGELEAGKQYVLNLHLGMRTVEFDAKVTAWEEPANNADSYHPSNLPNYAAVTSAERDTKAATVTLAAATTEYKYAVTGFTPGATVTATRNTPVSNLVPETVDASGRTEATATLAPNTKVKKITTGWAILEQGGKAFRIDFVQLASPLGLKVGSDNTFSVGSDNTHIQLAVTSPTAMTSGDWLAATTDATPVPGSITVSKNGTPLTKVDPVPSGLQFSYDETDGKITLGAAAAVGDIFTITLKTGDAPAETITVKAVS